MCLNSIYLFLYYLCLSFSFILADVPLLSLDRDGTFLVFLKSSGTQPSKCVDVHFMGMEVACAVENPVEQATSFSEIESTPSVEVVERPARLEFSTPVLEFGILPSGVPIQKAFWVNNLCPEPTKWKIVEVKYSIDMPPYMEIIKQKNVSCDSGEFFCKCRKQKIFYNVTETGPVSNVSMLLLVSVAEEGVMHIESLCVVTYEIVKYHVTINGDAVSPLLFPMKALYTGVPEKLKIKIENHSLIRGMFFFFPAYGPGTASVEVKIHPKCGVLKPLQSKWIDMKITSNEVGIFEHIYVPCFISKGQKCIIIRILCAVDSIHVAMYLPGNNNYYQRILWPPKILFEYDDNWMICPCTLEYAPALENGEMDYDFPDNMDNVGKEELGSKSKPEDNTLKGSSEEHSAESLASSNSAAQESSSASSSAQPFRNLKDVMQEQFGNELFLQDYVVEVHNVQLRTPTKITFYVENITPVKTSYTVDATNFYTTRSFNDLAQQLNLKKTVDIWNDMIMNPYGIFILPEKRKGEINGFEFIEIHLTIFANTWGIYQEEIAVDIKDIPCFTFTLLVEIVGCPVELPMGLANTTDIPIIRFGNMPYCSEDIERKIQVTNTSCIPLSVLWHCFIKPSSTHDSELAFNTLFDMTVTSKEDLATAFTTITDKYYGRENSDVFMISSYETKLEPNSGSIIDVKMYPENVPSKIEKTFVQCSILGHVFLAHHNRMRANYFFRPTEFVRAEIQTSLELPLLIPDFSESETTMRFYANDVVFDPTYRESVRLVFMNKYTCPTEVRLSIDGPLDILDREGKIHKRHEIVPPQGCLEVKVVCNVTHQKIIDLGQIVYPRKDMSTAMLLNEMNVQDVDLNYRILHLERAFKIIHKNGSEQEFPVNIFIYFPCISTKPTIIKLDQVLLGNTRKTLITVFNHTGCPINFEIYKTMANEELFITPHYGRIEKSTGTNKSFVNLFVYFTPREPRPYHESIRIVTNIPNYYAEVGIKASGTLNEKFYVEHKI